MPVDIHGQIQFGQSDPNRSQRMSITQSLGNLAGSQMTLDPQVMKWKFNKQFPHLFNLYLSVDKFIPVQHQSQILEILRCCGEFRHQSGRKRSSASIARKLSNQEEKNQSGFGNQVNTYLEQIEQETIYPKIMLE